MKIETAQAMHAALGLLQQLQNRCEDPQCVPGEPCNPCQYIGCQMAALNHALETEPVDQPIDARSRVCVTVCEGGVESGILYIAYDGEVYLRLAASEARDLLAQLPGAIARAQAGNAHNATRSSSTKANSPHRLPPNGAGVITPEKDRL